MKKTKLIGQVKSSDVKSGQVGSGVIKYWSTIIKNQSSEVITFSRSKKYAFNVFINIEEELI